MNSNIFRIGEEEAIDQVLLSATSAANPRDDVEESRKRHCSEGHNSITNISRHLSQRHDPEEPTRIEEDDSFKILRDEYIKILEDNTSEDSVKIIKNIYNVSIENAKAALSIENNESSDYLISIKENGIKKYFSLKNDDKSSLSFSVGILILF